MYLSLNGYFGLGNIGIWFIYRVTLYWSWERAAEIGTRKRTDKRTFTRTIVNEVGNLINSSLCFLWSSKASNAGSGTILTKIFLGILDNSVHGFNIRSAIFRLSRPKILRDVPVQKWKEIQLIFCREVFDRKYVLIDGIFASLFNFKVHLLLAKLRQKSKKYG